MISALFCVASAIYFEARGEPLEGQAAAALQGMLADSKLEAEYSEFAMRAYRLADAMLKERGYAK